MEQIRAQGVDEPGTYAQCIRAGDILYLAGQTAVDADGQIVGLGNVEVQAEFIWHQIGHILRAAGADYPAIAKVTTYVLNMDDREVAMRIRAKHLGDHLAASTLVAVSALARPEFLIEIEVTAVLEGESK